MFSDKETLQNVIEAHLEAYKIAKPIVWKQLDLKEKRNLRGLFTRVALWRWEFAQT